MIVVPGQCSAEVKPQQPPASAAAAAAAVSSTDSTDRLHVEFARLQNWTSSFGDSCLLGKGGYASVFKGSTYWYLGPNS